MQTGGQPPPQLAYVPAQQGEAPQLLTFAGAAIPGRTVLTHQNGIPVPDPARVSLRFVHITDYDKGGLVPPDATQRQMLRQAGLTEDDINQIFKSLDERVQVKAVTGCCVNIMILTIIGIPLVGVLFHRYKAAVKEWLDEINTKILGPKGLCAKLQTCYAEEGPNTSWLSIALTPAAAAVLRSEALWWVNTSKGCYVPDLDRRNKEVL